MSASDDTNLPTQGAVPSLAAAAPPIELKHLFPDLQVRNGEKRNFDGLAAVMTSPPPATPFETPIKYDNPDIPAGYTYLGQFINHDITIRTPSNLLDPIPRTDVRTCALDLDSLYGGGPGERPELYDGDRLKVGRIKSGGGDVRIASLRRDKGGSGKALIGDTRNDENLIVAQIHSAFIDFHNRMVDRLRPQGHEASEFLAIVQANVRKHFQWVVLWDYLPRICGGANVIRDIVGAPESESWGQPQLRFYPLQGSAFIPVEFSMAAFRFGHSMARISYFLNDVLPGPVGRPLAAPYRVRVPLFEPNGNVEDLSGGINIPNQWTIQWKYFFPFDQPLAPWVPRSLDSAGFEMRPKAGPQPSLLIDHELIAALAFRPNNVPGGPPISVIAKDLARGEEACLPSGQAIAAKIAAPRLSPSQLDLTSDDLQRTDLSSDLVASFLNDTPLFYYILKEAAVLHGGRCLGPVGRTIVAETLIGLLWHTPDSILRDPDWRPFAGAAPGEPFTMAHFLAFAYSHPENRLPYKPAPPWPMGAPVMV